MAAVRGLSTRLCAIRQSDSRWQLMWVVWLNQYTSGRADTQGAVGAKREHFDDLATRQTRRSRTERASIISKAVRIIEQRVPPFRAQAEYENDNFNA